MPFLNLLQERARDVGKLARGIPGNNLWWLFDTMDKIEKSIAGEFGAGR